MFTILKLLLLYTNYILYNILYNAFWNENDLLTIFHMNFRLNDSIKMKNTSSNYLYGQLQHMQNPLSINCQQFNTQFREKSSQRYQMDNDFIYSEQESIKSILHRTDSNLMKNHTSYANQKGVLYFVHLWKQKYNSAWLIGF